MADNPVIRGFATAAVALTNLNWVRIAAPNFSRRVLILKTPTATPAIELSWSNRGAVTVGQLAHPKDPGVGTLTQQSILTWDQIGILVTWEWWAIMSAGPVNTMQVTELTIGEPASSGMAQLQDSIARAISRCYEESENEDQSSAEGGRGWRRGHRTRKRFPSP